MSDFTQSYHLSGRRMGMFLCLCIGSFATVFGQSFQLSFKHLTPESGLSQTVNHHIVKDGEGFVWIGSEDGLNRFDGNNSKIFAPDIKQRSISGKNILGIVSSSNGNLWVGTENGLQCRSARATNFKLVKTNDSDGMSPAIPLGEYQSTILVLQPISGKLILVDSAQNSLGVIPQRLPVKDIERVFAVESFIGNERTLFLLADKGLFSFSWAAVNVNPVKSYNRIIESKLGKTDVQSICAQGDSLLWLATNKGLFKFFPSTSKLVAFKDLNGRICRDIQSMAIGIDGLLFAGTLEDGCLVISPNKQKIVQHFRNNLTDRSSLGGNSVLSIMTDTLYNVWMALDLVGIDFANSQKRKFQVWPEAPNNVSTFVRPEIQTMAVDSTGNIWTGNKLRGITVFDEQRRFLR
ncbi:MAG: two-component regulator propeller domain-containing protein, partial [Saprospiraceae bacterium]